jgi:hypothetical protein
MYYFIKKTYIFQAFSLVFIFFDGKIEREIVRKRGIISIMIGKQKANKRWYATRRYPNDDKTSQKKE